ncbi:MAG: metallophosphoesterase [Lentisphaeria bacterium]|nr:metallophosphoesterase [Lentisphaeria bacterium]MDY0176923.1 metallophosphoesterase [Lentisphaeria bacterium]NLZ61036.1 hypothetical protein [Lentisphaerota bacterium]
MYVAPTKRSRLWRPFFPREQLFQHGSFIEHRVDLPLAKLPAPCSLVFFSDLHWNSQEEQRYDALLLALQKEPPDYLLFGGDLFLCLDHAASAWDWLGQLPARLAKIAVLGNRESKVFWQKTSFWQTQYSRRGFNCLVNESLDPGPQAPLFFGLDDCRYGRPEWQACRELEHCDRALITLSHNPDALAEAGSGFIGQLCFSGHTHGGQIRLPLWGPLYTSSRYGSQFVSGWRQRNDGCLCHISCGIGESGYGLFRRRWRCPPEFTRVNLKPA